MHLEHTDSISRPAQEIYELVRDHIQDIVPYLPNVKRIEVLNREEKGGKVHVVNQWYANAEMPGLLKKVVRDELFSWKDTAVWDDQENRVDYSIESLLGNELYEARGVNYFVPKGDGQMELKVTCDVHIHPDRIPGIPKLMAGKVTPLLEKTIKGMLAPNLTQLGKGLTAYLEKT